MINPFHEKASNEIQTELKKDDSTVRGLIFVVKEKITDNEIYKNPVIIS